MEKELTQERVQAIARATLGTRVYLNKLAKGYYFSDYPEKDDRDKTEGVFYDTPLAAMKRVLEAADFLVDPDTNETMLMIVR